MSMLSMQNPPASVRASSSLLDNLEQGPVVAAAAAAAAGAGSGAFPFDSTPTTTTTTTKSIHFSSPLPPSNRGGSSSSIAVESPSSSSPSASSSGDDSNSHTIEDDEERGSTPDQDENLMWMDMETGEQQERAESEGRDVSRTPPLHRRTPPLRRKSEPAKVHQRNQLPKSITFAVIRPTSADAAADLDEDMMGMGGKVEELDDDEDLVDDISTSLKTDIGELDAAGLPKTRDASGAPATMMPRKRGRPRKHPLPTPGGQTKVAKGRSKTGCITCRRRKKKCDETKPDCMNCRKNAVVCEGYPPKEIWKSGKQKMEESVRRNSLSIIPRDLPILIDGIETDVDRRFLDHFVNGFSRVLTLINDDSNPFKEILLPMATQHKGLMHSLMCLAGSHLSASYPEPQFVARKFHHFDCALVTLKDNISRLTSDDNQLVIQDPDIGSTVALFLMTICEGDTSGQYRAHMDAARFLIIAQAQRAGNLSKPRNDKFREFVMEFFRYHEVSNSVTSLDRRPFENSGDLHLPDFVPHAQAGAFLGIFDGLFNHISLITKLRDRIRTRYSEGYEPAVDYQTLREAVSIDSALRVWEPSYPEGTSNWYAAQLYRQSTWVYLYRTIRPSRPSDKISEVVDEALRYLDQLPLNAGAYSIMLMPLFLLGCSAFEQHQRDRILKGFDDLKRYSNLRNIEPSLKVVKRVWEVMDTRMEDSWDWEKIISEMDMDFMIT